MKHFYFLLIAFSFSCCIAVAQQAAPTSDAILKEAYQHAAKEKKKVFIIFHASWCGWCHKMDSSMNDKVCKKFFDDNYVVRHLVVDEAKDKKDLENPGATEFRKKYHGDMLGIPFWLILDAKGNLLADSQIRPEGAGMETVGKNTGCPANKEEVSYFLKVLKKTSPLNDEQLAVIAKRFSKNEN